MSLEILRDFVQLPATTIADELERRAQRTGSDARPSFIEEGAATTRYGIERRALRKARRNGELVGHRFGRRILYRVADIEQRIAEQRVGPEQDAADDGPLERALAKGKLRRTGGVR